MTTEGNRAVSVETRHNGLLEDVSTCDLRGRRHELALDSQRPSQ